MTEHKLWETAKALHSKDYKFVDLTHTFEPGQPKFAALPDQN